MGFLILPIYLGFALFVLAGLSSLLGGRFLAYKLVLRGFRIAFEPAPATTEVSGLTLSEPVGNLLSGEPVYAAIVGRPAGLINFLREGIGLSRRFEFALSKRQAAVRWASFSSHSLQCAKLSGISALEVTQRRLNPLLLLLQFALITIPLNTAVADTAGAYDGYPLLTFLIFCGFAYYYFVCRITLFSFTEAGESVVKFAVYPALLERLTGRTGLDMPLDDANRLVQIFRVLKDA